MAFGQSGKRRKWPEHIFVKRPMQLNMRGIGNEFSCNGGLHKELQRVEVI